MTGKIDLPASAPFAPIERARYDAIPPRKYQWLTLICLSLILVGVVAGIIVPAGPGWDFANFYDTGRRVAVWQIVDLYNPESLIAGEQPQGRLGFYGAPISALLYAPLSLFSPPWAMVVFKIQNTLAYLAALALLYWHNRKFAESSLVAQWRFAAFFAAVSLLYQPFWTVYRVGGQSTPTVFLLLTLGLLAHVQSRLWLSAACMVAVMLIKPAFIFALALLVIISGWRFFKATAIWLALTGLASVVILGWSAHAEFLRAMLRGSQTGYPWFYNSSLYVVAENLKLLAEPVGEQGLGLKILALGVKAFVLATCGYLLWLSHSRKRSEAARRHFDFLLAIAFCLLISQTVWEHYLAALFPLLIYVIAARRQFGGAAMALVVAIILLSIGQNLIFVNFLRFNFSFDSRFDLTLIGLFKSAPLLLTLGFLCRYYREMLRSYDAPAWSH